MDMHRASSDLAVHQESLERLQDASGFGLARAVELGLRWLEGDVEVELADVTFDPPGWLNRRWGVLARVTLTVGGRSRGLRVVLPWLLDPTAATSARTAGIVDRVGQFRGTYWDGRFRQPLVSYVWQPGIHRITSPIEDGNTYRGLVVGEFGTLWQLRPTREDGLDRIVVRHGYGPLRPDERRVFDADALLDDPAEADLDELHRMLNDERRFASGLPASKSEIRDLVGWLRSIERTDRARARSGTPLARYVGPETGDSADQLLAVPMDEQHWRPSGLGDQLSSAVAHAVSVAAGRASTARELDAAQVVARIRAAIVGAVDSVARGRDEFSASVVAERPRNTLARVEAARQRTFIGFGGLESYEGRLDLRVLPRGWRGRLCPLQTQESANIGLIRHAALADWTGADPHGVLDRYADLSVAAALIPFVGHDDPTRAALGCKMLKQAVVLDQPEPPLIRTGVEALVAEVGASRAPDSGTFGGVDLRRGVARVGEQDAAVSAHATWPETPIDRWAVVPGSAEVAAGDLLAHAPDVRVEDGQPELAFGRNAVVAFLAWHGLNYEDGIVISASFAERMSSTHTVRLATAYDPQLGVKERLSAEAAARLVPAGTPILEVRGEVDRLLSMPEDGYLVPVSDRSGHHYSTRPGPGAFQDDVHLAYRVTRPLQVGDKLTTRHGGKGVVTRIEPDARMPRLPDGRVVEMVLNPLGVLGRLNIGTLMELAAGLELVLSDGWESAASRTVPRRLGRQDRLALAQRLELLGAPGGKLPLVDAAGRSVGPPGGVMAGPLYVVKLDHLARHKGGSRDDAGASPVTFQPVKAPSWKDDRRRSAPQRLGEMELWSLEAVQATRTIDDLMAVRGVGASGLREDRGLLPAGLRAGLGHLAVAGIGFRSTSMRDPGDEREISIDPTTGAAEELVRALWRGGEHGSGLEDAIETFAEPARVALAEDMRKSRAGEGRAAPTPWAVASKILELAIRGGAPDQERAGRGAGETVRYEILLPAPVDHPWHAREPGAEQYMVLPPIRRLAILPPSAFGGVSHPDRDPLRRRYRKIIRWVLIHAEATDDRSRTVALTHLDREVRAFLGSLRKAGGDPDTIAGRTTGKFGLLRRNGLGATAIRSGRAVLVGDPSLHPEHVRIPHWMADDLGIDPGPVATGHADIVLVNRQPTLHPYGLQALRAEIWQADAVALHPVLLKAIAGDFDGDTVAVHRLESEEAREEIWNLRRPSAALRSGADGELLAKLDQDVRIGLAYARATPTVSPREVAEAAVGELPLTTAAQRSAALKAVVSVHEEGLDAAGAWGPSVVDLDPPALESDLARYLETEAPDLYLGALSEAIGKIGSAALGQWLIGRGTATGPLSDLPAVEVRGSYLDGIADEDYFAAAQPAIAGIAAKKLITPFAGALTRSLVRHGYEIVITAEHCHADGRAHSIFECVDVNGPCAAAYGANPETGREVEVGEPVGIRAALFIGEKSTQKALKAIHRRSVDDSRKNSGKDNLKELAAILLRDRGRAEGFGGGGGGMVLPTSVPKLRGRRESRISHEELKERVLKTYPELAEGGFTPEIFSLLGEVLVARCVELLSGVDGAVDRRHFAVLIRHRLLHDLDLRAALPAGAPGAEPARSALLSTSVWTGRLRALVLELGVPAVWDERRHRLVVKDQADASGERIEPVHGRSATERLTLTLRNARQGVFDG